MPLGHSEFNQELEKGMKGSLTKYQRSSTGSDEEVGNSQDDVITEHYQDGAYCLQQPVDHVEPHRDKVPSLSQDLS